MKRFLSSLTLLLALVTTSAIAGIVTDSANIFGPRREEVAYGLEGLPVSVDTFVKAPSEGLKAYADTKAASNAPGFAIVITTQPREWRVSMSPVGLASSEGVRLAGERMVTQFKQGRFSEGVIALAHELVQLSRPPAPRVAAQVAPESVVSTDVASPEPHSQVGLTICLILGLTFVASGVVFWLVRRADAKAAEEKIAFEKAAKEQETYRAEQKKKQREREEREAIRAAKETEAIKKKVDAVTPSQKKEAEKLWGSYSDEERRRVIYRASSYGGCSSYCSGAGYDPIVFWLMYSTFSQSNNAAAATAHLPEPTPAPRASSSDDSYRSSSSSSSNSSSSDYSSSSSSSSFGSFDSGGGTSFSSSDSSGGGGSW